MKYSLWTQQQDVRLPFHDTGALGKAHSQVCWQQQFSCTSSASQMTTGFWAARCFPDIPEIHGIQEAYAEYLLVWLYFSLLFPQPCCDGAISLFKIIHYSVNSAIFLQVLLSLNGATGQILQKKPNQTLTEKNIVRKQFPLLHLMHFSTFHLHCFLQAFNLTKHVVSLARTWRHQISSDSCYCSHINN